MQQLGGRVVPRQTVPWAGHNLKQLRHRVHEIQYLGDEEYEQRLAKVAQDACHGQRHAGKVGEGVAHKHLGGKPVEAQEAQGRGGQREDQVGGEQVAIAYCVKSKEERM